jgi:hypothetical protein
MFVLELLEYSLVKLTVNPLSNILLEVEMFLKLKCPSPSLSLKENRFHKT